jgi:hypothetical protein
MTDLVVAEQCIPAMGDAAIDRVRRLEAELLTWPQTGIATDHVLHGGMYARTIVIPAGAALTGAFIRAPTLLIFDGCATVTVGDDVVTLTGRRVLSASAGRKQAFLAHADTSLTMVFATQAKTVGEAEAEFTDEAHLLVSRKPGAINYVNITGE